MNNKKLYIGISGKLGSGKNYIMENIIYPYLFDNFNNDYIIHPIPISFGDQIKTELLSRNLTLDYNKLFITKDDQTRRLLQLYGTENGRDKYNENIWIRAIDCWIDLTIDRISNLYKNKKICFVIMISDIRFINEANYILDNNGLLFKVYSPARNLDRLLQEINYTDNDIKHEFITYNDLNKHIDIIIDQNLTNNDKLNKLNKLKLMISHPSEISLDDYNNYDLIINNYYNFNDYNELYKIINNYINK
jgi:hypothetical protein